MTTSRMPALRTEQAVAAQVASPRHEIRMGVAIIAAFFVGLVGWSAFASMDAAVAAQGEITVSGHRQSLQAAQPGVVSLLAVKEGDAVRAGQVLMRFAPADLIANERALVVRKVSAEAAIARLEAEQSGQATLQPPPAFADLTGGEKFEADHALVLAQAQLTARLKSEAARRSVLVARQSEVGQQITGYGHELDALARQRRLNDDELVGMRHLAEQGYAPRTRVTALERSEASLEGDQGSRKSEIARLHGVIGETRLQLLQGDDERRREAQEELEKNQTELRTVTPQLQAVREQLSRTQIVAPESGQIVGLAVNAVGAVVAAGQRLMDVVPARSHLVVEMKVPPKDAAKLVVGRDVQVRFSALSGRGTPLIKGVLKRVSADSFTDDKTGKTYFTAEVDVPPQEMARLGSDQAQRALRPGLPVEVLAPVRKRTALEYWLEPLTQSLWYSLHEG